ncbi:MAG: hypothetical protein MJZ15_08735 [Bacteroidales bacterium]|nr:hypothetical protein [Bacteroidales bacterium]
MKVSLTYNSPKNIRRARHLVRRSGLLLTLRNGSLYTMAFRPGRQPDSEAQLKNRALFKEANDRVAADFANPSRREYWINKLHSQNKYKTARGLARAHYINILRNNLSNNDFNAATDTTTATLSLRPILNSTTFPSRHLVAPLPPSSSLPVYARLLSWRTRLRSASRQLHT